LRLKVRKGSEEYEKILTVLERRCERGETKEGAVVYRGKDTVATLEDRGDYVEVNVETLRVATFWALLGALPGVEVGGAEPVIDVKVRMPMSLRAEVEKIVREAKEAKWQGMEVPFDSLNSFILRAVAHYLKVIKGG